MPFLSAPTPAGAGAQPPLADQVVGAEVLLCVRTGVEVAFGPCRCETRSRRHSALLPCSIQRALRPSPCAFAAAMAQMNLLKTNDRSMKEIKRECEGNLELQTLVFATIEDYKEKFRQTTSGASGANPPTGPGA